MELEKIYQAIITGRAMLITGSGAHMDSIGDEWGKISVRCCISGKTL